MLIFYITMFMISIIPVAQLQKFYFKGSDYGPYVAECSCFNVTYPDRKNLSNSTGNIMRVKDKYVINLNTTINVPAQIDEIKVFVYKINNTKEVLWLYRVKAPCHHYALASVLKEHFKVNNNCIIQQGTYRCAVNLTDLLTSFFGTSFFYGDFMFKANTISKRGSIISVVTIVTFKRKK